MTVYFATFFIVIVGVLVVGFFLSKREQRNTINNNRDNAYSTFSEYTSDFLYDCDYDHDKYGIILVNIDTDKMFVGGKTFNISDIIKYEIVLEEKQMKTTYEDRTVIKSSTLNVLTRTITGGMIGGGVGAIVGAATAPQQVKTEKVRKNQYFNASYCLLFTYKNMSILNRACVYAKSEDEINRVYNYIDSIIKSFNNNLLILNNEIEEKRKAFLNAPQTMSVEQIKEFDKNSKDLLDSLYLSEEFADYFSKIVGIIGKTNIRVDEKWVNISIKSTTLQIASHNNIALKNYLSNIYGKPDYGDNLDIDNIEQIKKGFTVAWKEKHKVALFAYSLTNESELLTNATIWKN